MADSAKSLHDRELRDTISDLKTVIKNLNDTIRSLNQRIEELSRKLDASSAQIDEITEERDNLKAQVDYLSKSKQVIIRTMFKKSPGTHRENPVVTCQDYCSNRMEDP